MPVVDSSLRSLRRRNPVSLVRHQYAAGPQLFRYPAKGQLQCLLRARPTQYLAQSAGRHGALRRFGGGRAASRAETDEAQCAARTSENRPDEPTCWHGSFSRWSLPGIDSIEHSLKKASTGHALMLTKGSKRYTAKLGAVSEPAAVFIDVADGSPNGALASAQVVTLPPGLPIKIKKKIGTSPLTLLGVKGQQWVLTVGTPGTEQTAKVKAANSEPIRLTFDPKEGG